LLPGTALVAIRLYRYRQLQKDELERQCAAMLAQGIIRLSTFLFSVPVLLVKNKFPILVVDELLDELHGAKFFTKLDLRYGSHQVLMFPADIERRRSALTTATSSSSSCPSASPTRRPHSRRS
jgi:hypothetical protein